MGTVKPHSWVFRRRDSWNIKDAHSRDEQSTQLLGIQVQASLCRDAFNSPAGDAPRCARPFPDRSPGLLRRWNLIGCLADFAGA
jgi:hypothetical protein